jgi:diketogulonate reductase-like aldo/keto reductase
METNGITDRPVFVKTRETEAAIKAMRKSKTGETITWLQLSEAIGSNAQDHRSSIQTARKELLKDGIVFAAVKGVGYKRLDDTGIVDNESCVGQRIASTAKRSIRRLSIVRPEKLDPDSRVKYSVASAVAGAIAACASRPKRLMIEQAVIAKGGGNLEIGDTLKLFQ